MSKRIFIKILLFVFLITQQLFSGERTSSIHRIVRFEHRLVNESEKPEEIRMFISAPQSNERQDILYFFPEPGYVKKTEDEYGNQIIEYVDQNVTPGEVVAHGWIAEVELYSYVYDWINPAEEKVSLSEAEIQKYLQNAPNYQYDSPFVSELAKGLAANKNTKMAQVRSFFDFLINEVKYERDMVWEPAPEVIRRKSGSCSEYNYAFLALCRAAGIPCRYSGGIVLKTDAITRYDENMAEDAVFHRWSEVFLPETGWFPVDCSRGSTEIRKWGNPYSQFGRLPANVVQTVRGDGAGKSPLKWDYLSMEHVNFKASGKDGKVGFWINEVPKGQLKTTSAQISELFSNGKNKINFEDLTTSTLTRELLFLFRNKIQQQDYPMLIQALKQTHNPATLYWTILAQKRQIPLPYHQTYPFLCDGKLTKEIQTQLNGDDFNLLDFEYWWRKARPLIVWDQEENIFKLPEADLNLF